ncbi:gliding motility associated protein GldN [compost metagenome]
MKKIIILSIFLFIVGFGLVYGQSTVPPVKGSQEQTKRKIAPKKDGYIFNEASVADTVVPYPIVNKEDIAYTKRIWREIDLRDRGNAILASPKINLVGIIYEALHNGELDMYASDDESFQGEPLSQRGGVGNSAVDTAFLGVNRNTSEVNRANNEFFAVSFVAIRIKEDWILDIRRGIFEPRIIGIAPIRIDIMTPIDNNGNPVVDPVTNIVRADTLRTAVGWFYFDDLREILVKHKIVNNGNDNSGINFDDVFTRRLFYSNITKTSNAQDYRIEDLLLNPKDRLLESERIKKALADFEQSLWQY